MSLADQAEPPAALDAKRPMLDRISLGALALTGASVLRLGLQFVMMPVLARLIGPSEYGLVALAMPFILLANVLADGGLAAALGRNPVITRGQESTAFWLAAATGSSLAIICAMAAYPIGLILHQPRLPHLLLALSPIMLMNSLAAVSNGRIVRERRFAVFAAGDLISTGSAAVAAFAAAMHGWGAWSLVAQQLVLWVCKLTWVSAKAGARIGFLLRWRETQALVRFGLSALGSSISDFVSRNVDNMIVGAILGPTPLGYYAMAYQIVRIPDMLISGPFFFYILTAMSRAAHAARREGIQRLAYAALRLGSTGTAPLFCGLALVADLAVSVVLGPKWLGAITALRFLAGAGLCFSLWSLISAMLLGLGRAGLQVRMASLFGLATVVTVGGAAHFGVNAVSGALAGGLALLVVFYVLRLARELGIRRRVLATAFAPGALGCAAMTGAILLVRRTLAHAPEPVTLVAAIGFGACAYVAVIGLVARKRLAADLHAFSAAHAEPVSPDAHPTAVASAA